MAILARMPRIAATIMSSASVTLRWVPGALFFGQQLVICMSPLVTTEGATEWL
jgi:hypothetical protein